MISRAMWMRFTVGSTLLLALLPGCASTTSVPDPPTIVPPVADEPASEPDIQDDQSARYRAAVDARVDAAVEWVLARLREQRVRSALTLDQATGTGSSSNDSQRR